MKSNSWVIVNIKTGESVFETYSQTVAEQINKAKYEALTTHDYLVRLNERIKSGDVGQ